MSLQRQQKQQQLLGRLQDLLLGPKADEQTTCEVLDYFLRRLGSSQVASRVLAMKVSAAACRPVRIAPQAALLPAGGRATRLLPGSHRRAVLLTPARPASALSLCASSGWEPGVRVWAAERVLVPRSPRGQLQQDAVRPLAACVRLGFRSLFVTPLCSVGVPCGGMGRPG